MRYFASTFLVGFVLLMITAPARAQTRLEQPPQPADSGSARRGAFLLATAATVGTGVAGTLMATEENPLTADEAGVILASSGLIFGPTLGYVANQDWEGALQGTTIRLVGAGITAWIASSDEYDHVAVIPASFVAVVAILDLVDLSRPGPSLDESRLSVTPGYDPHWGSVMLTARGSF